MEWCIQRGTVLTAGESPHVALGGSRLVSQVLVLLCAGVLDPRVDSKHPGEYPEPVARSARQSVDHPAQQPRPVRVEKGGITVSP